MKFKFIGEDNSFCLELVAYKIKSPHGDYLFKEDIVDVPDKYERVISALKESAVFEEVTEKTKGKKDKKEDKKINDK